MFGPAWPKELPLTQKEALEFADRWKVKRDKYPNRTMDDTYQETKLEMGLDERQSSFMDFIIESFIKHMEKEHGFKKEWPNTTSPSEPQTP
jgi:hypothetical protein